MERENEAKNRSSGDWKTHRVASLRKTIEKILIYKSHKINCAFLVSI